MGVVSALWIQVVVKEGFVMPYDPALKFRINDLARNPDAVFIKGLFEHDPEAVSRLNARKRDFALQNARDNSRHSGRDSDGKERSVQSSPLHKMTFKNGAFDGERLLDKLVFKLVRSGILEKQVDNRRVR